MTLDEAITQARYVVDASGRKTEVILPFDAWQRMLSTYERLLEMLEDQEDQEVLRDWLAQRASGNLELISLDDLERELIADGLLLTSTKICANCSMTF